MFEAAMVASIAHAEDLELLRDGRDVTQSEARGFYTSVDGFGRTLGLALAGLEAMSNQARRIAETGVGDAERARQWGDDVLLQRYAELQQDFLNPALPFHRSVPWSSDLASIGSVYEAAIRNAVYAGGIATQDPKVESARRLLFVDDGDSRDRTPAYKKYLDFESERDEARDALDESPSSSEIEELHRRLARIEVEWLELGRKREIDEAIATIERANDDAGFHDEQASLIARLEAGKREWPNQGTHFFESHMSGADPLFSDRVDDPAWRRVDIAPGDLPEILDAASRAAAGLDSEDIDMARDTSMELSFEYVACDISREWLDPSFFTATYWRNRSDDEVLSDGRGGGALPCLPKRVVFARDIRFTERTLVVAEATGESESAPAMMMLEPRLFTTVPQAVTDTDLLASAEREGLFVSARLMQASPVLMAKPMTIASAEAVSERPASVTSKKGSKTLVPERPATRDHRKTRDHLKRRSKAGRFKLSNARAAMNSVVASVRGKPKPGPSKAVTVAGSIADTSPDGDHLENLVVSFEPLEPAEGSEEAVEVSRVARDRLTFSVVLKSNPSNVSRSKNAQSVNRYAVILRDGDGVELIRNFVEMKNAAATIKIEWRINEERSGEMWDAVAPVLHGYVLTLVPSCPRPDESLDWQSPI